MRHVIIGNSAAGVSAVETLRRVAPDEEVILVSEDEASYSRSLIPYYIAGRIAEDRLRFRPETFCADLGVATRRGRVISVDASRAQAAFADGGNVSYDRLLIATGASPVTPPIPGIESHGVFPLRTAANASDIAKAAAGSARAVVVGGGLVGLLAAKAIHELGLSVTVVEAVSHLLPQQLDPAAAQIVSSVFRGEGIALALGQQVSEIVSRSGRVSAVVLSGGETIEADVVVVGVGVRPNLAIAKDSGIEVGRGILVDSRMQTSAQDIYAAGDVAEVADFFTGQRVVSATWIAASEQGKIAAYNMAGIKREYEGALPVQNAADFFGLPVVSVGLIDAPDDSYETLLLRQPGRKLYKKLVLKDDVVKGMISVGDIARSGVITGLIRSRTPVTEFKDELLSGNFGFSRFVFPRQTELGTYV